MWSYSCCFLKRRSCSYQPMCSSLYCPLCTPASPASPSRIPFYCAASQFGSLNWQKTNSAIKKRNCFPTDLNQLIVQWVPECDPERGEDSAAWNSSSAQGSRTPLLCLCISTAETPKTENHRAMASVGNKFVLLVCVFSVNPVPQVPGKYRDC